MASVPGLSSVANIPIDSVRKSLAKLMSPDPDSRSKEHEGRRIAEIEGGWVVLNGEKYRNYMSRQERNEYQAKLMSNRRANAKKLAPVSTKLALLGQAEAEAEAGTDPPIVPQGGLEVEKSEKAVLKKTKMTNEARIILCTLNELTSRNFRETDSNLSVIMARLAEPEVTVEGVKQMLTRQAQRWKGTDQEEYLRPETLFRKSKFDSYYAAREIPIQTRFSNTQPGTDRNRGTFNEGKGHLYRDAAKLTEQRSGVSGVQDPSGSSSEEDGSKRGSV
jgi:uncharacterized phage protein (TIGR02220 family)